jgi:hypothetical protein
LGVREVDCRLDLDGKNFDKTASNLARTAQIQMGGETLRVLVENRGTSDFSGTAVGSTGSPLVGMGLSNRAELDTRLSRERWHDGAAGD